MGRAAHPYDVLDHEGKGQASRLGKHGPPQGQFGRGPLRGGPLDLTPADLKAKSSDLTAKNDVITVNDVAATLTEAGAGVVFAMRRRRTEA